MMWPESIYIYSNDKILWKNWTSFKSHNAGQPAEPPLLTKTLEMFIRFVVHRFRIFLDPRSKIILDPRSKTLLVPRFRIFLFCSESRFVFSQTYSRLVPGLKYVWLLKNKTWARLVPTFQIYCGLVGEKCLVQVRLSPVSWDFHFLKPWLVFWFNWKGETFFHQLKS